MPAPVLAAHRNMRSVCKTFVWRSARGTCQLRNASSFVIVLQRFSSPGPCFQGAIIGVELTSPLCNRHLSALVFNNPHAALVVGLRNLINEPTVGWSVMSIVVNPVDFQIRPVPMRHRPSVKRHEALGPRLADSDSASSIPCIATSPWIIAPLHHAAPALIDRGAAHVVRVRSLGAFPHHAATLLPYLASTRHDAPGQEIVVAFHHDRSAVADALRQRLARTRVLSGWASHHQPSEPRSWWYDFRSHPGFSK